MKKALFAFGTKFVAHRFVSQCDTLNRRLKQKYGCQHVVVLHDYSGCLGRVPSGHLSCNYPQVFSIPPAQNYPTFFGRNGRQIPFCSLGTEISHSRKHYSRILTMHLRQTRDDLCDCCSCCILCHLVWESASKQNSRKILPAFTQLLRHKFALYTLVLCCLFQSSSK